MSHYFLGVPLPDEVRRHLQETARHFKTHLNYGYWTDIEDYHITLLFLGAVGKEQLTELQEKLTLRKNEMHSTQIRLNGFGTFGKRDQPRVLWMGVKSDHFLYDDQTIIKECVAECGMDVESRPYRPHITIAKKWRGESVLTPDHWNSLVPKFQPMEWTAEDFNLFEVNPQKTPRYTPIKTFSLT